MNSVYCKNYADKTLEASTWAAPTGQTIVFVQKHTFVFVQRHTIVFVQSHTIVFVQRHTKILNLNDSNIWEPVASPLLTKYWSLLHPVVGHW